MSEFKPNTGKAWIMKPEAKQKRIDKYMTDPKYSWFVSLSDEEKQQKIPVYTGTLNGVTIPEGQDCQIEICKEISFKGQPQLGLRIYQTDEQKGLTTSTPQPAEQPASDPFGEDPFAI